MSGRSFRGWTGLLAALLALLACRGGQAAEALPMVQFQTFRICPFDGPAPPRGVLAHCSREDAQQIGPSSRARWLVAEFDLPQGFAASRIPKGLFLSGLFSAEAWLNGVKLGAKGRPGTAPGEEVPGPIDAVLPVPPNALAARGNRLALLISTQALSTPERRPVHGVRLGPYAPATSGRWRTYLPALLTVGAIVVAGIYFFAQGIFGTGRAGHFLLGAMCVAALVMLGAETSRAFVSYPYNDHVWRMWGILTGAILFGFLLSVYVSRRSPGSNRYLPAVAALLLTLPVVLFVPSYDGKILGGLLIFFLAAFVLSLRQWRKGLDDAALLAGATGLFLAAMVFDLNGFLDRSVYLAFATLLTALMFMEVRAHRRALRRRHEAELAAARLEGELSKGRLQPHFLMNTLTSLMEWVEQKPEAASRMIEALSEEYRLLRDLQPLALVRVAEELALCRRHLDVMKYRADREFRFETVNVDPQATIPPGIFHTLIENAFSHGGWKNGNVFTIEESRQGGRTYRFIAPGVPATEEHCAQGCREGVGLSYIRARLREAYGESWRLVSRPCGESWETIIGVPDVECSDRRG